jgi:hypothetical protein
MLFQVQKLQKCNVVRWGIFHKLWVGRVQKEMSQCTSVHYPGIFM